MDGTVVMMGGAVEGIKLEWSVSGIDDIVPSAGGNKDTIIVFSGKLLVELVFGLAEKNFSLTVFDAKELIVVGMNFKTDVTADFDAHKSHLEVFSGPNSSAKSGISFS